jgi:hypothetical protein
MSVTLVVYPAVGANTFVDLTDADNYINQLINYAKWDALSQDDKSRRLIDVYGRFFLVKDFVPPSDLTNNCLPQAQSIAAAYILEYGIADDSPKQQVRVERFGPVHQEFFKNASSDGLDLSEFPPMTWVCLEAHGGQRPETVGVVGSFRSTR